MVIVKLKGNITFPIPNKKKGNTPRAHRYTNNTNQNININQNENFLKAK